MPTLVILGSQWGDEGKGKIVDILSEEADVVARYQGGSNAGHTVVHGDKQYILHLVPSGILHAHCRCLIGNGVVVDPNALTKEIRDLEAAGFDVAPRLLISDCAHLVLPYHRLLDVAQEKRRGKGKIGTTGRGIGCAYADKAARCGLRMGDLRSERKLRERIRALADFYEPLFEKVHKIEAPKANEVIAQLLENAALLVPMLVDGPLWLNRKMDEGANVLIEGAQGIHLDIDHGTYPFVTSSNPTPGGVCAGLGISPGRVGRIAAVAKAYTTRVGEGPMPSEFDPALAETVRRVGGEYGATTGRPRRCGWFDAVVVRRSILLAGIAEIILTKLDVLDALDTIKIAARYRLGGAETNIAGAETNIAGTRPGIAGAETNIAGAKTDVFPANVETDIFPTNLDVETPVEVIYEELPGWKTPTSHCRRYDELPPNARRYVERIETLFDLPVSMISVSADRDATIRRKPNFFS